LDATIFGVCGNASLQGDEENRKKERERAINVLKNISTTQEPEIQNVHF
jgi:hypothetical protein